VLEDIAAVEGAGVLDPGDPVAQGGQRCLGSRRLGLALVGARAGDDGEVAVDDNGVLHEYRVGAVVGWRDLDGLPAFGPQGADVPVPLAPRQVQVDRGPGEMGEQALGQARARAADECALVHGAILSHGSPVGVT
jgi:hypothetical protein